MPYADSFQNACLPVSLSLTGKAVWSASPPSTMEMGDPRMLTVAGQTLFVSCQEGVYALDTATGKMLWEKAYINYADPFMTADCIRTVTPNHYLEYLSLNGTSIERFRVPILVDAFRLFYLYMDDDRMFLVLNRYPTRFDEPEPQGFILTNYSRRDAHITWYREAEDLAVGYVVVPETGKLFVATEKHLYQTTLDAVKDSHMTSLDINGARSLSMDHQGNLLIMKHEGEKQMLLCTDQGGVKKWRVSLPELGSIVHPAASTPGGVVYCSPDKILFCIKDGVVLWQKKLRKLDEYGLMLTTLSDNSVIAAGMNNVVQISQKGDTLAQILVPFVVTCRPVADGSGRLYVAGAEGVGCYQ